MQLTQVFHWLANDPPPPCTKLHFDSHSHLYALKSRGGYVTCSHANTMKDTRHIKTSECEPFPILYVGVLFRALPSHPGVWVSDT